jgi:hypothetical protein
MVYLQHSIRVNIDRVPVVSPGICSSCVQSCDVALGCAATLRSVAVVSMKAEDRAILSAVHAVEQFQELCFSRKPLTTLIVAFCYVLYIIVCTSM